MYGKQIMSAAFLRPALSANIPEGTAPQIAPIANIDAIHVACSSVMCISASVLFNCSSTGDVQDNPVPAAAAPKHT